MGIFKQTFFMIIAIIIIIIGLFVGLTIIRQDNVIMKVVHNQARSIAISVARINQDAMLSDNFGFIVENTMTLIQRIPNISYIIYTKNNSFSLIHTKKRWERLLTEDPSWKIGDGNNECGQIIYSDLIKKNVFHYVFPVKLNGLQWGYVYIGLSIDPIQQDKKEMYVIMLLITTVCMFMGAVLAFLFSRRLTKPILILEEVTRQIARGDLTTRANIITNNEIKSLANSFNTMTERLKNITVSKAYVDNIIQNMNDSLIVVNRNYLIETINKATEKLLGYSSEELLNQSIHMIIPDKKNDSFFYDLKNMSTRQVIFPKESYYINKKGQMIPVLLSVAEMRETPEDNYHAYLILALNLSEKKETELALKTAYLKLQKTQSQLVQSGKLASIGELAAGVAHELNQPLMVIRSTAQYIQLARKKNKFTMDEMDELIDTLEKNTSRMMKIINHLRMFSRQSEKEFTQVNVNKVIEDAFLLLSEQLRLRNISVNQELANHLPEIFGDPNQLEQVILNLLSNARDAITTKMESCKKTYAGIITISTQYDRSDTGYITISVKDNGSGIDESIVEKIFDPFYTTKDVGKGTGLGLSISYGIIEAHKGKIRVSFSDKKETIFTIKLPVERNNNE